jgi:rRNA biogenesis protein RRP5
MAPIKRKGNAPEETATRQPQKRAKVGAEDRKNEQKPKDTTAAPKASELSVLRDDEPSFPRGGGSVLTPLERKQIQIQAHKDVLFEQKGPKKPTREFDDNDDDEEEEDVDMEDADAATSKKSRKKKAKGKKSGDKEKKSEEKESVRIEPLTYKVR